MDSMTSELNSMTSITEAFAIKTARYKEHSEAPNMSRISFWREFCSGMTMFKQRIGQTNVDLSNIVRTNLKLLHKNFLACNEYRHYLNYTKSNNVKTWTILAKNKNIMCGILTIFDQKIESLHNYVTSQLTSNFQFEDVGQIKNCLIMIYVIEGKLAIEQKSNVSNFASSLKYSYKEKRPDKILKQGDAGLQHTSNEINLLRSTSHSCQILVVAIPTLRTDS